MVIKTIIHAGLELRSPFVGLTDTRIENRVIYHTRKLHKSSKIQAVYSAHDFRHYFAITEYSKNKDIYRVSKLLGHAGIRVTETYLKGLGVIE
ncbi:MAG: tyrosine-type recombinase/integrase [Treponema sp.]|jgi:integrase|nr:tyrosine-type recombinase/integrase [Treponema sp.]